MKLLLISTLYLATFQTIAQEIKFTVGETIGAPVTEMPAAETFSADVFHVVAHVSCQDELQKEIWEDYNGLQTVVAINGKTVETKGFSELEFLYSFQAEEGEEYLMKPSIRIDIPLKELLKENAPLVNARKNKLQITVSFADKTLATGEFSFDVPEFGIPAGEFCDLRPNYLEGEEGSITAITNAFKSEHPDTPLLKAWLPYSWGELEDGSFETTGMALFGNAEKYSLVPYKIIRTGNAVSATEDNQWLREFIHPECVKAFLAGK